MKFIAFILILLALNSCAEKPEAIEPDKKIHCEHFSKHSRELPVVSSAIEIFEGQQFGGVLESEG